MHPALVDRDGAGNGASEVLIPNDVRRFVLTSIPSVPYLEALLLFDAEPEVEREAADVAGALYLQAHAAAELLTALRAAGFLQVVKPTETVPRYRYAPSGPAVTKTVARLAQAYASDLIGITNMIHDGTHKNAQRFADAFKLRKD